MATYDVVIAGADAVCIGDVFNLGTGRGVTIGYIVEHLMHITGLAKGSDGLTYFLVKNSWGDNRGMENYQGYVWVSENYFKLNTISIMLHKDGVSKKIIKKSR